VIFAGISTSIQEEDKNGTIGEKGRVGHLRKKQQGLCHLKGKW